MTVNLANLISEPRSGRSRAVLLDHHDYSQSVILQGRQIPWHEPMAYANFMGQAQGLLRPDLALLSLDRFYAHKVASDDRLQETMGAKSRTGYALRTLLADPGTLAQALAIATTFTQTQREPVVLHIPSPMQWLARTHPFSGAADASGLDADNAENASMYIADWIRGFSALPLAGVLLDDRTLPGTPDTTKVGLDTYSPLANVADNYRWTLGMRSSGTVEVQRLGQAGAVIQPEFWLHEGVPLPEGSFFVAEIPPVAAPEDVMSRLAALN